MPYPPAPDVALALAVMLRRSGQTRARISVATLRLVARRPAQLRRVFMDQLTGALEDFGWLLAPLDRGGYAAIATTALAAARPVTARRFLGDEDLRAFRRGDRGIVARWEAELGPDPEEAGEPEDGAE